MIEVRDGNLNHEAELKWILIVYLNDIKSHAAECYNYIGEESRETRSRSTRSRFD